MIQIGFLQETVTTRLNVGVDLVLSITLRMQQLSLGLLRLMSFLRCSAQSQKGAVLTELTPLGTTNRGMSGGLPFRNRLPIGCLETTGRN